MKIMCYNSLCSLLTRNKLVQHYSVTQMQVTASDSSADFPLLTFLWLHKYNKVKEVIFHVQQHYFLAEKVITQEGRLAKGEKLLFSY